MRQHENILSGGGRMSSTLINGLFVFMLAAFIGFEVIRRVSPLLHTPLMSLTNALDAIAVVGAIVLVGRHESRLSYVLGMLAVIAATSNIVGGFLITDRMLKMFQAAAPPNHEHSARNPARHRNHLSGCQHPFHPVAEMDEFAEYGPARHLGRRNRHAAGHRRHAVAARHRRLHAG